MQSFVNGEIQREKEEGRGERKLKEKEEIERENLKKDGKIPSFRSSNLANLFKLSPFFQKPYDFVSGSSRLESIDEPSEKLTSFIFLTSRPLIRSPSHAHLPSHSFHSFTFPLARSLPLSTIPFM
jgi:hypothetical protein